MRLKTFATILFCIKGSCIFVDSSLPRLTETTYGQFPEDFIWGVASSNYQFEGATHQDDKGESVWDAVFGAQISFDGSNGDIAANSYNLWREDIEQLELMGMKYYRLSIAWPRILPTGRIEDGINQLGIKHYNEVLNGLVSKGIEPIVTICHYDLPQGLRDRGGWLNEKIIDWYMDYAKICFDNFGDKVKYWLTFNSPALYTGLLIPTALLLNLDKLKKESMTSCFESCSYEMVHHQLLAHARAWHLYDKQYRPKYKGKIGITANADWYEPGSTKPEDVTAAERAVQFELGWVLHPIIKGDNPAIMKDQISRRSKAQGFGKSRLPEFTPEEIAMVKGTYDFIGLNTYTTYLTFAPNDTHLSNPLSMLDSEVTKTAAKDWVVFADGFRYFVPWGIRKLLNWVKNEYGNPPLLITENGWADKNGSLHDTWRVDFFDQYVNNVLKANKLDYCNVIGYIAWAASDEFEWFWGYSIKFGLVHVDFKDPKLKRTPKLSSRYFAQLARDNGFIEPAEHYNHYLLQKLKAINLIDSRY